MIDVGPGLLARRRALARRSGIPGMIGTPAEKPAAGQKARALQMRPTRNAVFWKES
jgi:hypothetical protein